MGDCYQILKKKILNSKINLAVIGLGYVGLPLALLFGKKFKTIGIDTSLSKIKRLRRFIDDTEQCSKKEFQIARKIKFTNSYKSLYKADIIIVCLPTPIDQKKIPDLKILKNASKQLAKYLKKDSIVVYESTVYPGLTDEVCRPILEKYSKLKWKKDFFIGYSPERVNPNDKVHTIENISKIVSGDTNQVATLLKILYSKIIKKKIFVTSSIKVAEAAKVIENTQRDINIALMNELSIICHKLNINTKEVIDAASTKWNFLKFYPGLVGGHCIGVDPYYLTFKSKKIGYNPKIISSGRKLNDHMVDYLYKKIMSLSKDFRNFLFLGATFKENCNDVRNSQNAKLIHRFIKKNINISVYDPYLVKKRIYKFDNFILKTRDISEINDKYDAVILLVPHKKILNKIDFFLKKIKPNGYLFDIKSRVKLNKKHLFNTWAL
jgi:UDP-N-acetyl-D-galactosamine dehydrogenase